MNLSCSGSNSIRGKMLARSKRPTACKRHMWRYAECRLCISTKSIGAFPLRGAQSDLWTRLDAAIPQGGVLPRVPPGAWTA